MKREPEISNFSTYKIKHPVFGTYTQIVYDDLIGAGHRALASEGKYGWGMPLDPASELFVNKAKGKNILEVGTGLGDIIVIPSLINGANKVFATDISIEHLDANSLMRKRAVELNMDTTLSTYLLEESWWDKPLIENPSVESLIGNDKNPYSQLPPNNSIDLIMARHSLQFGDPDTVLKFLDLVSAALKVGGIATAINFTPYTEYMYQYDQGKTMENIVDLNIQFMKGLINLPGGYLHSTKSRIHLSLAQLMKRDELDRNDKNRFLYFDEPTLIGLIDMWRKSREARRLPVDLFIADYTYFSPPSITRINKLISSIQYQNCENFVFNLIKN